MNAQPEENGRPKGVIILQAAGHCSGGSGIRISASGWLLADMDRNLRSPFLDSIVYAERDGRIGRHLSNIAKNKFAAKMNIRFAASAAVQSKTGNFSLQDTVRGTPPMGVPESVPVRAYQCLDWAVSRSRLFRFGQVKLRKT
jgi:hypothetical protein